VQKFILIGSPLSIFISCYFTEKFIRSKLPTCEEFCNLYHPSDFIAYRIEPLIKTFEYSRSKQLKSPGKALFYNIKSSLMAMANRITFTLDRDKRKNDKKKQVNINRSVFKNNQTDFLAEEEQMPILPPVLVPYYKNKGLCKIQQVLTFLNAQKEAIREPEEVKVAGNSKMQRYDYVLQEKGLEAVIKSVGMVKSHTNYFLNKDVAGFVLMKIHNETIDVNI
jgi:hypothetical protein